MEMNDSAIATTPKSCGESSRTRIKVLTSPRLRSTSLNSTIQAAPLTILLSVLAGMLITLAPMTLRALNITSLKGADFSARDPGRSARCESCTRGQSRASAANARCVVRRSDYEVPISVTRHARQRPPLFAERHRGTQHRCEIVDMYPQPIQAGAELRLRVEKASEFRLRQVAGKGTRSDASIQEWMWKKNKHAGHREFRHQDEIAARVGANQTGPSQNFRADQPAERVVEPHLRQKARESDARSLLGDRKIAVEGPHISRRFVHQPGRAIAEYDARIGLEPFDAGCEHRRVTVVVRGSPLHVLPPRTRGDKVPVARRADVARLAEVAHARVAGRILSADCRGPVGRRVVRDYQFEVRMRLREHRVNRFAKESFAVEDRHTDADERPVGGRGARDWRFRGRACVHGRSRRSRSVRGIRRRAVSDSKKKHLR